MVSPDLIYTFRNRSKCDTIQRLRSFIVKQFKERSKTHYSTLMKKHDVLLWLSEVTGYKISMSASGYIAIGSEQVLSLFCEEVLEEAIKIASLDIKDQFFCCKIYKLKNLSLYPANVYFEKEEYAPSIFQDISEQNIKTYMEKLETEVISFQQYSKNSAEYKKARFEEFFQVPISLFKRESAKECFDLKLYNEALIKFKEKHKDFFEQIESELQENRDKEIRQQVFEKNLKAFWKTLGLVLFILLISFILYKL